MKKLIKPLYHFLSKKHQNVFLDYKVDFKPRFGHGVGGPHPLLNTIIDGHREGYKKVLSSIMTYKQNLWGIEVFNGNVDPINPQWNNDFLPGLDIMALYTVIADTKPNLYIEIGSGNSTKVVSLAKREQNLDTTIVSIDPMPRAEIDQLADEVHRVPAETITDFSLFDRLEKGDVLFIDNSHRCLPNSDVTVFFLEILPRLKPGVIVHVHDIYMPYDYPQFMCDRAYSEQYMLAMATIANPHKYIPYFPNYFVSEDKELSGMLKDFWENDKLKDVERHGGSYWFTVGK